MKQLWAKGLRDEMNVALVFSYTLDVNQKRMKEADPELSDLLYKEFSAYSSKIPPEHAVGGNMYTHSYPNFKRVVYEQVMHFIHIKHRYVVFVAKSAGRSLAVSNVAKRRRDFHGKRAVISAHSRPRFVIKHLINDRQTARAAFLYASTSGGLYLIVGRKIAVNLMHTVFFEE